MDREMKDFTRHENKYGLYSDDCSWLRQMGLRETQWILDAEFILFFYGIIIFNEWINE